MPELQNASVLEPPPLPFAGETPWALFLDLDGTLLEIAAHPDAVHVPDSLEALLDDLHGLLGGGLAIVSGREVAKLKQLLPHTRIDLAGCHGAQLSVGGRSVDIPPPESLSGVAARLIAFAGPVKGLFVEIKSHGVALHYRATSFSACEARTIMEDAVQDVADEFRVIAGKAVVEVVPKHVGKNLCVQWLMQQAHYSGRRPVFIGDDTTDEDAFELVNGLGGYSVHVGAARQTQARYRLPSVAHVLQWLAGPLRTALGPDCKEAIASQPTAGLAVSPR